MRSVFVFSSILLSTFQVINGGFADSMNSWYPDDTAAELEVRAPLPDTGYWNFLPIAGIYGRMLHFLLTDTEGFGNEIKELDFTFKKTYGTEFYVNLESHVAESFPVADFLFKSIVLVRRIGAIRDAKTGKTLGQALMVLRNISNDRKAVETIVDRWGMVKDLAGMFRNPGDNPVNEEQLNKIRQILLEHPEVIQKLLTQPDVLNRVSGSILQSLEGIDVAKGIESVQEMALLLKTLFPQNYQQIAQQLMKIEDDQTGLSFSNGLETVSNVMKTPEFQNKLKTLLNTEALQQVHKVSQRPLAQTPSADAKAALNAADVTEIQRALESQGVMVTEEKAGQLIEDAKNNRLFYKLLQNVAIAENSDGGLTAVSVSESFEKDGILVSAENVDRFMQLLQLFPPELLIQNLRNIGLEVKDGDVLTLIAKAAEVSPLRMDFPTDEAEEGAQSEVTDA